MIPVLRLPQPRSRTADDLRVYAEPGVGVRAGKGFGAYVSGKVMLAFLSTSESSNWKDHDSSKYSPE